MVEKVYAKFGAAICDARKAHGWTQEQLAAKTHLSRGSIANIEVGRQRVLLHDLFTFAKILKLDAAALFAMLTR